MKLLKYTLLYSGFVYAVLYFCIGTFTKRDITKYRFVFYEHINLCAHAVKIHVAVLQCVKTITKNKRKKDKLPLLKFTECPTFLVFP